MTRNQAIAISVFSAALLCAAMAPGTRAAQTLQGGWAISSSTQPNQVELMLFRKSDHGSMNSSNSWPLNQLSGLSAAQLKASSASVRFAIAREAGRLECSGTLQSGSGGGTFTFTQNPEFIQNMRSLGYSGLSEELVFAMAIHDVTTAYVRDVKAEGVQIPSSDTLLALRIHNVSIQFIRDMKRLGNVKLTADNLIAMKIHGVTAEFAQSLKDMGYQPKPDSLVALRIHGVTSEFARELKRLGYSSVTLDQMVAMRIHGVTPEFIRKVQSRGLRKLSIDELVSLKIHGIVD